MKIDNVKLVKLFKGDSSLVNSKKFKDCKDRIFYDVDFKETVVIKENSNPIQVSDLGFAKNFRKVNGWVVCDVEILDKFEKKLLILEKQEQYLHPFLQVFDSVKDEFGFNHVKKFVISGLFFNRTKLYAESNLFKKKVVKEEAKQVKEEELEEVKV